MSNIWLALVVVGLASLGLGLWLQMRRIEQMIERWEHKQDGTASAERKLSVMLDGKVARLLEKLK